MDYNIIAKEILTSYSISAPAIQFMRHNENITYRITDGVNNKNYLLRIHKPIYDADRIDTAIEELKYCAQVNLFSKEHYDIIKKVLILVKNQINELNLREDKFGIIHADLQLGNIVVNNGNPCLIDLGFCGFGYYLFDLGSAATILPSELRQTFLQGYSSKASFSFDDIKYIEGQIFMDTFISYVLFTVIRRILHSTKLMQNKSLDSSFYIIEGFIFSLFKPISFIKSMN